MSDPARKIIHANPLTPPKQILVAGGVLANTPRPIFYTSPKTPTPPDSKLTAYTTPKNPRTPFRDGHKHASRKRRAPRPYPKSPVTSRIAIRGRKLILTSQQSTASGNAELGLSVHGADLNEFDRVVSQRMEEDPNLGSSYSPPNANLPPPTPTTEDTSANPFSLMTSSAVKDEEKKPMVAFLPYVALRAASGVFTTSHPTRGKVEVVNSAHFASTSPGDADVDAAILRNLDQYAFLKMAYPPSTWEKTYFASGARMNAVATTTSTSHPLPTCADAERRALRQKNYNAWKRYRDRDRKRKNQAEKWAAATQRRVERFMRDAVGDCEEFGRRLRYVDERIFDGGEVDDVDAMIRALI